MKCKIQWVGEDSKPTPDENEAIMMIQRETYKWQNPYTGLPVHFNATEWFPCCTEHAKQLSELGMEHWKSKPIE